MYALLFIKWHILAVPRLLWYQSDMDHVLKCFFILHNVIIKQRFKVYQTDTKNIVSVDPNAAVTPVRTVSSPTDDHEASDSYQETAALVQDGRNHVILTNTWAECDLGQIWTRID